MKWITDVRALLAEARKAVVAVAGVLASLLTAGLLPDPAAGWVASALAVLAALGVYAVPNRPAAPGFDPELLAEAQTVPVRHAEPDATP